MTSMYLENKWFSIVLIWAKCYNKKVAIFLPSGFFSFLLCPLHTFTCKINADVNPPDWTSEYIISKYVNTSYFFLNLTLAYRRHVWKWLLNVSLREFVRTLVNSHHVSWPVGDRVTMFPVLDIDQNDIVDTNGAGDAFVGGTDEKPSPSQLDFCVLFKLTFVTS